MPSGGRPLDITGQRYGRLVAESPTRAANGKFAWIFLCDCGNRKIVEARYVRSGGYVSCGCARIDTIRRVATKHGSARPGRITKEYRTWCGMIRRCVRKSGRDGDAYFGKGVTVCDRWKGSFEAFLEDVGSAPSALHSIDRIDFNGDYEPGNVRWATNFTQARNKRTNRWIDFRGERRLACDVADQLGIPYHTFYNRIFQYGWSVERATTEAVRIW